MQILLAVGFGGALGAVSRYWLAGMLNSKADKLPLGTLSCNVIGSLVMGVLFVLIMEKAKLSPELRPMLMVGFLGAFTTFSSFSLETVALLQEGHTMSALIYVLLSVILCIIALSVGIWFTRLF
ncbi:fluoride efflux transporter CrcB [Neptunomonas phycophila]|uniref:fluoride efflux transporter CrcB n=1 Tax=Neptunomonas phycophila TaxID=1572645 RepID=UPI0015BE44C2|nr:fluoride efflux transporter CrcB [Neptunomonas phycophila]QLE97692.1 fluoride efflux transporter CrcB [Neptunomonas phycophila]